MPDWFLDLVTNSGPLAALVMYFVWQSGRREVRLSARIEKLEDDQRQVLLPLVERCTTAIRENTRVLLRLDQSSQPGG